MAHVEPLKFGPTFLLRSVKPKRKLRQEYRMPGATIYCPVCNQKSSSQLIAAHLAAYHRSDIQKLFTSDEGIVSTQSKYYSTLNLKSGDHAYCCWGCKSGWLNMNIANKHKDGECLVKHQNFLAGLDERSLEEKLFSALETIQALKAEVKNEKEMRFKAETDLRLYDQKKSIARRWEDSKFNELLIYIEKQQSIFRSYVEKDLSGNKTLRDFQTMDANAKLNFRNDEHVPLSETLKAMREMHKQNLYLKVALFPSVMGYQRQLTQQGGTVYIHSDTWLGDTFRHYHIEILPEEDDDATAIRMPNLSELNETSYKAALDAAAKPDPIGYEI